MLQITNLTGENERFSDETVALIAGAPRPEIASMRLIECLGNTRAIRLLSLTTQDALLPAAVIIKVKSGIELTKDVRRSDGWTIAIDVVKGRGHRGEETEVGFVVTHSRREQSLDADSNDNGFEIAYELRIVVDKEAVNVESADLRITSLEVGGNVASERRDSIQRRTANGSVIIA